MSSSEDDQKRRSYKDDSFERAEDSILDDLRSSHFAVGRRESVFLAESSSAEEIQESSVVGQTISLSEGSTPSIITEEQNYSDQFESIADINLSEEGSFTKVYESTLALL